MGAIDNVPSWEYIDDASGAKMHVISRKALRAFWEGYEGEDQPALEQALKAWFREAKKAEWDNPSSVKEKYGSASILKNGRVVFNICGNKFRIVVRVNYAAKVVYIRWVGTHADYDSIDAEEV